MHLIYLTTRQKKNDGNEVPLDRGLHLKWLSLPPHTMLILWKTVTFSDSPTTTFLQV